jgi:shikimate dehydrogenase
MDIYGLIGYPLGHSFSKEYFTGKFKREGLPANYELFPLQAIDEMDILIKNHPGLKGLNVTIPFKQAVLKKLDDVSGIPPGVKACNCIKIVKGKTYGFNTDVTGFERSIEPHLKNHEHKALVLGDGGAAEAVKYVFEKHRIDHMIVSRKQGGGPSMRYEELDEDIISRHLIIVNTTPVGMYPSVDSCPDIPYDAIGDKHFLFDLIYNPAKTLFLQKGEERGARIQNGYGMLVIQAEESWRIWNGD